MRGSERLNRKMNGVLPEENEELAFTADLEQNEAMLKRILDNCADVEYRSVESVTGIRWLIVYVDNLIDSNLLDEHVIKPMQSRDLTSEDAKNLAERTISIGGAAGFTNVHDAVQQLFDGHAAILTSDSDQAVAVCIPGSSKRSIEEPSSEPVIRGAKDGFVERLSTNLSLIRTRLKTPKLKIEYITLGKLTHTRIAVAYLDGVAKDSVVEEVRKRLKPIRLTGVVDSAYIEECIEDEPFSPFPQTQSTERPDVVAAELLEGRVAIIVDCSPFALIVPMTFWSGLQASEDYYIRWPIATFIRWIRFLFVVLAIFAPSLYVAVTTFHQEMIPTNLVLSIAGSREGVPFPAMMEALIMEFSFEALREAGIRLPKQIGQAVSIVGGLVIGQAAVQAGFISAPVVIIVSITGIAAFTIPRYSFANGIRILRFPLLFLAGGLGLYGVVLGFLAILSHVTSMRSFGTLYFSPIAPFKFAALKDILLRVPIWASSPFKPGFGQGQGEGDR